MVSVLQGSFAGGELSPNLYSRVDLARWSTALKTCRNFITQPYGGVKNRPGTKFMDETKNSAKRSRLLPFKFSETQTYMLEVGDGYVRFFANGTNGPGPVMNGASVLEIASPYAEADLPGLVTTQSADVMTIAHPSYQQRNLNRRSQTSWDFTSVPYTSGPFLEMNIDTTATMSISADIGVGVTVTASKALFTSGDIGRLISMEQRNYGLPWEVSKAITVIPGTDTIRRSDGKYYRALASGTTGTLRPTHSTDSWSDGGVEWQYMHSGYGVAKITAVAVDGKSCTVDVLSRFPSKALLVPGAAMTIASIGAATATLDITLTAPHGKTDPGLCDVSLNGPTYNGTLPYTVIGPSVIQVPNPLGIGFGPGGTVLFTSGLGTADPTGTYRWRLGAWGGAQGWPSTVTYHQGRRTYAGSVAQPQMVWMSRSNSYEDFSLSTPLQDDDALTFPVLGSQPNPITGMLSMDKLAILTAGAEWVLGSGLDDVLTPANIAPKLQGFRGSSALQPIGAGDAALYVQSKGQVVRDMVFDQGRYNGSDLTVFADHLLEGKEIVDWCYQQFPFGIVWMVRNDGILLGMTYMREQQVVGWHRHDTDGEVESVGCISEKVNGLWEDALYMIVKRTINGATKRYVERMQNRLVLDIQDAFFVDCGLKFDGTNTSGTTITLSGGGTWDENDTLALAASAPIFTGSPDIGDAIHMTDPATGVVYRLTILEYSDSRNVIVRPNCLLPVSYRLTAQTAWKFARNVLSGLEHLEGKEVAVLGDGNDLGRFTVAYGAITLDRPVAKAVVGLPYNSDLETLSLAGGQDTPVTKKKTITSISAQVLETRGLKAGRDFNTLYASKSRSNENYDAPARLQDGLVEIPITSDWGKDGSGVIRQDAPLPITITSLIPEVHVGGV